MNTIDLAPEMADLLANLQEQTELRSTEGRVLGVFIPRSPSVWTQADLEEAERVAATEREGYTLQEVKEYLQSLEKPG